MKPFWIGNPQANTSLWISIPHSGEFLPSEAFWLTNKPQSILLTDVDRFVNQLYQPIAETLGIPMLISPIHRYVADLNRSPEDIDPTTVEQAPPFASSFKRGLYWKSTTKQEPLLERPLSQEEHHFIVQNYHLPFHQEIKQRIAFLRSLGLPSLQLDCHSMPSQGTCAHADQGKKRPDVVLSDYQGKAAHSFFKNTLEQALVQQNLLLAYNDPYLGGYVTQHYGKPSQHQHTLQIEINRSLYMDEDTKAILNEPFRELQSKLHKALESVQKQIPKLIAALG